MKKVSFTSKAISLVSSLIILFLVSLGWWLSIGGFESRSYTTDLSLFEFSSYLSQVNLFNSTELALTSLFLSIGALVLIVFNVISALCTVASKKTSYVFNTVTAVLNCVISITFIIFVIVINSQIINEFNSARFGFGTSTIWSSTKSPYLVVLFSVISRVVLIPRTPTVKAIPQNKNSTTVCPVCKEQCAAGVSFCNKCGANLKKEQTVCPSCNSEISADAAFCNKCGAKISVTSTEGAVQNTDKENNIHTNNAEN